MVNQLRDRTVLNSLVRFPRDSVPNQAQASFITGSGSTPRRRWLRDRVALPPENPGERLMAPLLFVCPKTNQQAATDIETDVQGLSASSRATLKVNCPYCGEAHEISVRETYINGALRDATDWLGRAATMIAANPRPMSSAPLDGTPVRLFVGSAIASFWSAERCRKAFEEAR